jgi:hypothetical protein
MTENAGEFVPDSPAEQRSADHRPAHPGAAGKPMESTRFASSDPAALADLQMHWGSAYEIGLDGDIWSATFRGSADELRAHTCLELRVLIRADYAYRQQAGPARRADGGPDSAGGDDVIRGERMSL